MQTVHWQKTPAPKTRRNTRCIWWLFFVVAKQKRTIYIRMFRMNEKNRQRKYCSVSSQYNIIHFNVVRLNLTMYRPICVHTHAHTIARWFSRRQALFLGEGKLLYEFIMFGMESRVRFFFFGSALFCCSYAHLLLPPLSSLFAHLLCHSYSDGFVSHFQSNFKLGHNKMCNWHNKVSKQMCSLAQRTLI